MFERFDLVRYWRFATPVAAIGLVGSLALLGADLLADELPDAVRTVLIVLFVGIFPVHLGSVVTFRFRADLLQHSDDGGGRWRRILLGVAGTAISAVALVGLVRWETPDAVGRLALVTTVFYAVGLAIGSAVGRTPAASGAAAPAPTTPWFVPPAAATPPSGPLATPAPPPPGPTGWVPGSPRGPWSVPSGPPPGVPPAPLTVRTFPLTRWPWAFGEPNRPWSWAMLLPFMAPALFLAAFLVYVAVLHPTTDSIVGPPDRPFYVATGYDTDLGVLPHRGELLSDPPAPIQAAVCRNYHDFLDDRTLRSDLVIVDDPGLIRSAELLDGPYAGDQVALDTEVLYVRAGRDSFGALLRMHQDGWSHADIEHGRRYLAQRNDPPSAGAADRYVVYTVQKTTWSALMVRLAVEPEAELVAKPMLDRIGDISVRLPDGSMARVNESLCWK